jgi:hypothetical protein
MAGRGRTSYQKRLKEQQRLERRQAKAAKKLARNDARGGPEDPDSDIELLDEDGQPIEGQPQDEQPQEGQPQDGQPPADHNQG